MIGLFIDSIRSSWKIHAVYILIIAMFYVEHSISIKIQEKAYDRMATKYSKCESDINLQNHAILAYKAEADALIEKRDAAIMRANANKIIAYKEIERLKKQDYSGSCEDAIGKGIRAINKVD